MAKKAYLECGKVLTAHGVRGAVCVASYCDTPGVLCALPYVYLPAEGGYRPLRVLAASLYKGGALMTLSGIEDRESALLLHGKTLYARREDIPLAPGAVLIADMLTLPVIDAASGRVYGQLAGVEPSPASDLYDILTPNGQHVLLPAVPAFLDRIDIESGIYIRPIPGFFDEDGEA